MTTATLAPAPAGCTLTDQAPHFGVKVGDYFYSSWGYDQTNVDFYKVVALTAKCVKVVQVRSACVEDNGPQTYLVPTETPLVADTARFVCPHCHDPLSYGGERARYLDADAATSMTQRPISGPCWVCYSCNEVVELPAPEPTVMTKRLKSWGGALPTVCAARNSYSSLYAWDGSPKYQTGSGWGH